MKWIKRRYDRHYHENLLYREAENSQRNRARLAELLKHARAGRLLEIGCGKGGFLRLAEEHFDVECMDVSKYAVAALAGHFGGRVRAGNIEDDTLPHACYDAVAAFNILEHLRDPARALAGLSAALKPGGMLIGSVPNNRGLVGAAVTRLGNFFDRTHVATYPPETWMALFPSAGLALIDQFGEITFGRNRCAYVRGWEGSAFNWMFVCRK